MWGDPSARYPLYVGVEIECGLDTYGKGLRSAMKKWGATQSTDGSILDTKRRYNMEIKSAPARGKHFEDQIEALCQGLQQGNARVNVSCGLHVHVDARDMTEPQILSTTRLYCRIEPALYSIVARSRRTNHYSKAYSAHYGARRVRSVFQGKDWQKRAENLDVLYYGSLAAAKEYKRSGNRCDSRYRGMNLNSIHEHGTVEFRLHQGTVNATKILMWSAICSAVIKWGMTHPDDHVELLKGSPIAVLEKVLAEMLGEEGNAQEVIHWTRIRRRYFLEKERQRKGLKPIRKPQKHIQTIPEKLLVPEEEGEHQLPISA